MDTIIKQKKVLKSKHIYWLVGIAIFLFLIAQVILGNNESVYRTEKDKISIQSVESGLFNDYISITGQVEPISTIYLDAEEGGKVEAIYIEEGEMVKKGDVILKLRNTDLNTSIMSSESQLAYHANEMRNTQIQMEQQQIQNRRERLQVDLQVTRTKRKFLQYERLYNEDLIAREDFMQAREEYELAVKEQELTHQNFVQDSIFRENQKESMDESLNNTRLSLQMARERLDNLNVKAPIDGQLGLLDAEIGQSVSKGQRLGLVNVLTNFKITANIDEHYIDRVKRNLNANFERNNQNFALQIKKIYPEVREGKFRVDMVFTNQRPDNIRTGQSYYIKLQLGQAKNGVLLPRGGFFQSTGGQWIYVLNADGTEASKRSIKLGKQNPKYYEVIEGLKPGEQVITSSYETFGDNDKIILK